MGLCRAARISIRTICDREGRLGGNRQRETRNASFLGETLFDSTSPKLLHWSHVITTERRETYSAQSVSISIRYFTSSSGQLLSLSLLPFLLPTFIQHLIISLSSPAEQLENLREQLSVQQAIADGANNFLEVVANDGSQEELKFEIEQELQGAQTLIERLETDITRLEQLIGEFDTLSR